MENEIIWVELEHPDIISGRYLISEYGNIYSKATHKFLQPFIDKDGYERIELTTEKNKYKKFYIHRLVAWMYVSGYSEKRNVVNHINSIRDYNHYSNLEWVTPSENDIHGYKYGNRKNNNQKYSEEYIKNICKLISEGYTNQEILKIITGSSKINKNNKKYALISQIRNKDVWSKISDKYF